MNPGRNRSRTMRMLWAFIKRHALVLGIGWAVVAIVLGTWGWRLLARMERER